MITAFMTLTMLLWQKYPIFQVVLLRASRAIIVFVKKVKFIYYSERQQVNKHAVYVVRNPTYLYAIFIK